ncbi:hypothetical protein V1478_018657, partial [Vespula squamosa]
RNKKKTKRRTKLSDEIKLRQAREFFPCLLTKLLCFPRGRLNRGRVELGRGRKEGGRGGEGGSDESLFPAIRLTP